MTFEVHNPWVLLVTLPALAGVWWAWRRTLTDFPRVQRAAMLAVRALVVVLLVLALAGIVITRWSSRTALVMMVDTSPSVSHDAFARAEALVSACRERTDNPLIHGFFDDEVNFWPFVDARSMSPPAATDVARALRVARASVPAEYVGRIVLLTDGCETTGDMRTEARRLRDSGVELVVVGLPGATGPEVIARKLEVSGGVTPGATVELLAHVASSGGTP
ncbi:MAG TPA: vWA domain-containing protein, partial [Planctomycetota bacterium]|nr:vWA domain-containing protein [Planctomycetota bacterium]